MRRSLIANRPVAAALATAALAAALAAGCRCRDARPGGEAGAAAAGGRADPGEVEPAGTEVKVGGVGEVELLFAGEVVLGPLVQQRAAQARRGAAIGRFPYQRVAERVRRATVAFTALRSVLSGRGAPIRPDPAPRAGPEWGEGLRHAGFDVVSLANDAVLDWGEQAAEDTWRNLRAWDLAAVGMRRAARALQTPQAIDARGLRLCALAYNARFPQAYRGRFPGPFPAVEPHLAADVRRAAAGCDAVVVLLCDGRDFDLLPGERPRRLARAALDAGATLVVAWGARVVQPIEFERDRARAVLFGAGSLVTDHWRPWAAHRVRRGALVTARFVRRRLAGVGVEPITIAGDHRGELGGDLDPASLLSPGAPPGLARDDLLARLSDAEAARGPEDAPRACAWRDRLVAEEALHGAHDCGGDPRRSVGRTALLSGGALREVVRADPGAGDPVRVLWPDALLGDAVAGFAGLDDHAVELPGGAPVDVEVHVDDPGIPPLRVRLYNRPGWVPLRLATPGRAGRRRAVTVRIASEGGERRRVGFRLWTVREGG